MEEKPKQFYKKPRVIEIWLVNGQFVTVATGVRPRRIEHFGVKWLHLEDDDKTLLDIRLDSIVYMRNYTKVKFDSMLATVKGKEEDYE